MCGSTYTWILKINTTLLNNPWLVESTDLEPLMQSADCSYMWIFDGTGIDTHFMFKCQL